jgi:hypothetical protein
MPSMIKIGRGGSRAVVFRMLSKEVACANRKFGPPQQNREKVVLKTDCRNREPIGRSLVRFTRWA